ncbi:MAG TPA: SIMPL domain-containing protein [Spongiibacteraceae bacterium]|nr:SIMPL domain-containing protein [Spongiibacteraceae bacterium]
MKSIPMIILFAVLAGPALAVERVITVKGAAEIEVAPDIVTVSYAVIKMEPQVADAKAYVDKVGSDTIRAAIAQGVKEEDISSSNLDIRRELRYDDKQNKQVLVGYTVTRNVTLTLRKIDNFNKLLQALVDARLDEVQNIQPGISTLPKLKAEALKAATDDAKLKADLLAGQFQGKRGEPLEINEERIDNIFPVREVAMMKARGPAQAADTYEFKPGKIKVSADVFVKFALVLP